VTRYALDRTDVIAFTIVAFGVLIALIMFFPLFGTKEPPPPPARRCQTIPAEVAAWGLSVQSTPLGLYFCYQQGAGQGMIEVVCTPMKECP
jgi:hypothetical protein